ncbi:MAG: hypothetical protein LBG30_06945 [Odoribacteraceae bacterium]|jgi:hypothetical protein|nr:hypothetical protein [Odoribacteraceae bacterium]
MENDKLRNIYNAFAVSGKFISANPLEGEGAYRVITNEEAEYILQCFPPCPPANIPAMIWNKEMVYGHIRSGLINRRVSDITRKHITCFHTHRHQPFYKDHDGNHWTLSLLIKETNAAPPVDNTESAREIGNALGAFVQRTKDFDPTLLKETYPAYQNVRLWQQQLDNALKNAGEERQKACAPILEQLRPFDRQARDWQDALDNETIPRRVAHNNFDTKSVLLDRNQKTLCLVRLKTVMPGILHYDFGDGAYAAREPGGQFNNDYFSAFTAGFMEQARRLLARKERDTLHIALELMPYLQASRRLVRYLREGLDAHLRETADRLQFLLSAALQRAAARKIIDSCP